MDINGLLMALDADVPEKGETGATAMLLDEAPKLHRHHLPPSTDKETVVDIQKPLELYEVKPYYEHIGWAILG